MNAVLWHPGIAADGTSWSVISSALLDQRDGKDRVRLFNRGTPCGEVLLEPGDGAALLQRLGLEESP
jgi:hypothetical protein